MLLTREQVREVDRRAIHDFGMCGLVLMENAGRGVAQSMLSLGINGPVVVCCGKGNNGGDGFVIARHLDNAGRAVHVLLFADPADLRGDAAANWHILEKAGIRIDVFDATVTIDELGDVLAQADWIVDALLGTGATGEPHAPIDAAIAAINRASRKVMAVDLPSGLDCDSGVTATNTIVADHTCTFVAAKPGFLKHNAIHFTGRVSVIDIGVPRRLLEQIAPKRSASPAGDAS
jgi:NAD(P)H-hydrate epimerase